MSEVAFWCIVISVFPFAGTAFFAIGNWMIDWIVWFVREQKEFLEYERAKNEWLDYEPTPEEFLENKYGN